MASRHFKVHTIIAVIVIFAASCGAPKAYKLGEEAFNEQRYAEAITHFSVFLLEHPEHELAKAAREKISVSYYKIGAKAEAKGKAGDALMMYRMALKYDNSNDLLKEKVIAVYYEKGEALMQAGYYQAVIDYATQGVEFDTPSHRLADIIADAHFMQGQNVIRINQLLTAKNHLIQAVKISPNERKRELYERLLVGAANNQLRQENYYESYLYFTLLAELKNNPEYTNLANYALSQIKPTVELYPMKNPLTEVPSLLMDNKSSQVFNGVVTNPSKRGFLLGIWGKLTVIEPGDSIPALALVNLNLLDDHIGFMGADEVSTPKTILPLEPGGKRDFYIKTDYVVSQYDSVTIEIMSYQYETERPFATAAKPVTPEALP